MKCFKEILTEIQNVYVKKSSFIKQRDYFIDFLFENTFDDSSQNIEAEAILFYMHKFALKTRNSDDIKLMIQRSFHLIQPLLTKSIFLNVDDVWSDNFCSIYSLSGNIYKKLITIFRNLDSKQIVKKLDRTYMNIHLASDIVHILHTHSNIVVYELNELLPEKTDKSCLNNSIKFLNDRRVLYYNKHSNTLSLPKSFNCKNTTKKRPLEKWDFSDYGCK